MQPTILCPWDFKGAHNEGIKAAENKLIKLQELDSSIVAVTPTRAVNGGISPKWVLNMMSVMKPMNQRFTGPVFIAGLEVGEAYNAAIRTIFNHPELHNYKFMLTWEDDVIPQPDALLHLVDVAHETGADVVSSVYWSKGEAGFPMIYGDASDPEINFRPMHPNDETYRWCYGTGMGFTLFRLDQFEKYWPGETEWFQTVSKWDKHGESIKMGTQDLVYMEKLVRAGGTVCVAQHAKAGHYDSKTDVLW